MGVDDLKLRWSARSEAAVVRVVCARAEEWSAWLAGKGAPLEAEQLEAARRIAGFTRFAAKPGQTLAWSAGDRAGLVVGVAPGGRSAAIRSAAAVAAKAVASGREWAFELPP